LLLSIIQKLENKKVNPLLFILAFFSVVVIRMLLESVVYLPGLMMHPANFILHFHFFYLALFFFMIFILHFFTGTSIEKTSMLMLPFLPIIWLPPILDFIASKLTGETLSRIVYVKGDFDFLLRQFFTFYADMAEKSPTLGLKTETLLIYIGIGGVVWLKTRCWWKSVLAAFLTYVVVFFFGCLPDILFQHRVFRSVFGHKPYLDIREARAAFFGVLIFFEMGLWYYRYDPVKFKLLLHNIRFFRIIHYLGMLGFGLYIGFLKFGIPFELTDLSGWYAFILLIILVFSIWMSSVCFNDVTDIEADRLSKPYRPLAQGVQTPSDAIWAGLFFTLFCLFFSATLSWTICAVTIVCLAISTMYSFEPFRIKKIPFLATLAIAFGSLLIVLIGYAAMSHGYFTLIGKLPVKVLAGFPPSISLMILLCFSLSFTTKDVPDYEGDKATGTLTLPVMFGLQAGKKITGMLVLFSFCSVPFILHLPWVLPFALLAGLINFFVITRPETSETVIFLVYYSFMLVVGIFVFNSPEVLFL
jgi:4-hydroxybenzoate polyprenyltransferase